MAKFKCRFAKGASGSSNGQTVFAGIGGSSIINAENRVDAFVKLYKHLLQEGDVTVISHVDGQETLLGFDKRELEAIDSAGIPLNLGFPKSGAQIEQIIEEV